MAPSGKSNADKMRVQFLVNKDASQSDSRGTSSRRSSNNSVRCEHCGLTYSQRGNLNKHIKTAHVNERPHKCKYCHVCFHFADGLQRHVNLLHSDAEKSARPFKCGMCGATFRQRCHLSKHFNFAHRSGR